jgi:tol-pal system protein YbgF
LRTRWILLFGGAILAGALGGSLFGPAPAGAVAREIIELQTGVNQLITGQQSMQTEITQNAAVQRTLIEQSLDSVNKLNGSMSAVQKTTQDFSAASGARLDTMGTQVQGLSDNVADLQARIGKLDQKLTDIQNTLQNVDSKLAAPAPPPAAPPSAMASPNGTVPTIPPGGPAASSPPPASADILYSNALRDINGKHYDLATQEFQDYMKYYGDTDLASNAQFYLGEVAYMQNQYQAALDAYNKVIENYPKSYKTATARMRKGYCLAELGQKASAVRELRAVVRLYPGTDDAKRAAAKLKEMGATVS